MVKFASPEVSGQVGRIGQWHAVACFLYKPAVYQDNAGKNADKP
jgi:hypothetical protein